MLKETKGGGNQDGYRTGKAHGKRKRIREKIKTWNVCGLGKDKAPEIVDFMKKQVLTMGISDCRMKENALHVVWFRELVSEPTWEPTEDRKQDQGEA